MLATICDDTWNVLNMQHIIPNSKRCNYSNIPSGGHKYIKGPAQIAEGGQHFRKATDPHLANEHEDVDQYAPYAISSEIMPC